jgi:phosphoribosylformimino-5-aminoimidazole carboxamide ribotide isomerase
VQGRFDLETRYEASPIETAHAFWRAGARSLHVVDLDAARTGVRPPAHRAIVAELARTRPVGGVLQVGGGFRDADAVDEAVALGVDRVLLGTLAFRKPAVLDALVARHGARICVAADTLAGSVRVAGWAEDSAADAIDAIRDLDARGVEAFLVTAIERDGTLAGPDLRLLGAVRAATSRLVLASGGVGSLADVLAVRATGVDGVVVGRALYAGAISIGEALAAAG